MLPPLVQRALELERAQGFDRSCAPEIGRLLHVLAAERARTRVAEIGTGAAVGAAWIVSALAPQVPFFTAELDPERAAAAAELFRDDENVHVLLGDWRETLPPEAPFDLLFFDAAKHLRPREDAELAIGLLSPGGLAVLDDLTDPVNDVWLTHPALAAVRLATNEADTTILAVRR
ncbi:MAG: class I SAM-dependent methyltransferase [Actinobacteria bacterium]|nr:class I SAM-dependent methyltransferase [Actinomycetota bacterium]